MVINMNYFNSLLKVDLIILIASIIIGLFWYISLIKTGVINYKNTIKLKKKKLKRLYIDLVLLLFITVFCFLVAPINILLKYLQFALIFDISNTLAYLGYIRYSMKANDKTYEK